MKNKTKKLVKMLAIAAMAVVLVPSSGILYAQTATTETSSIQDTVKPRDVDNLHATAGDALVQLGWDSASDNAGVTGYKIYYGTHSVQSSEDRYDLPIIPVENVTNYTVQNLINGQTYFFAATALDAAGNESVNYSSEVSATPQAGARLAPAEDDGRPPQVAAVSAEDIVTVKVVFSEPIRLPEEQPASAFTIETSLSGAGNTRLAVQNAQIDTMDLEGKTVLLTTAPQESGSEYVLTAGIELSDYFGNPIVSGTSDTGSFRGSAVENTRTTASAQTQTDRLMEQSTEQPAALPLADTDSPLITSGSADFGNRIALTFSEKIVLPANPTEQFIVYKNRTQERLNILNVSLSVDGKTAYLTTAQQEPVEYEVFVSGVTDEAGNQIPTQSNSITVSGRGAGIQDLIPPEDVAQLIARIKDAQRSIIELQWQPSRNSAGDLADQLLSQGVGRRNVAFGTSTSLGTSTSTVQVADLTPGNWYTFKLATADTSGNRSAGALASIFLPQTGPGAAAAGLTALVMGFLSKRKRRK